MFLNPKQKKKIIGWQGLFVLRFPWKNLEDHYIIFIHILSKPDARLWVKNFSNFSQQFQRTVSTPLRTSEINEKNWCTKVKPFLTFHLRYEAMLKVSRKSWEPFRIYQLTITANPTQFHKLWPDWLCVLVRW